MCTVYIYFGNAILCKTRVYVRYTYILFLTKVFKVFNNNVYEMNLQKSCKRIVFLSRLVIEKILEKKEIEQFKLPTKKNTIR